MTKKYTNNLLFEAKVSFTVYLTKLEHQKHFGNVFVCNQCNQSGMKKINCRQ